MTQESPDTININPTCPSAHLVTVPNRLTVELRNPKSAINRAYNTMEGFNPDNHIINQHEHVQRVGTEVNIPDRFELFLLGDGEKKITEAIDTRKFISSMPGTVASSSKDPIANNPQAPRIHPSSPS
jgi:hypothetical protein